MNEVFLLLGGNMGDRFFYLEKACERIEQFVGRIERKSAIYETEPWGFSHENSFLNQVILVRSSFSVHEILRKVLRIEKILGRVRYSSFYTARTIDIDILFFNQQIISQADLIIPHPHLHKRLFTLYPLAELASEFVHPLLGKSISNLLVDCEDISKVKRIASEKINLFSQEACK